MIRGPFPRPGVFLSQTQHVPAPKGVVRETFPGSLLIKEHSSVESSLSE